MDEKLSSYRKKKARQKLKMKILEVGSNIFSNIRHIFKRNPDNGATSTGEVMENSSETDKLQNKHSYFKKIVIFVLWLLLYSYFVYLEFGAVFFCASLLIFIYFNTRTGKKDINEISAYSVFNEGCERIDGTFTAEQVEKQIRTGML